MPTARVDYNLVPTVVFSHPVIGTIGLTEQEAREKYPASEIKIYTSTFVNLYYGTFLRGEGGDKPLSKHKLICLGPEEKVIGLHAIGMGSDELLQGFGVAMKMGATKGDFDRCIAIHPTAAEEMVTLPPWGALPSSLEK
jgi:glutathione reductase (NADPH)